MTDEPAAPPALSEDQLSGALFRRWNAGALVFGLAGLAIGSAFVTTSGKTPSITPHDPTGFLAHARWDDGKAEVARYDAVRTLYGKPRAYELVRIVVKEPFDPAAWVKADTARAGVLDALKLITSHDTPTGRAYRYRQQLVVRVARADARHLLDASMSSQEWCGNTFVRLLPGPKDVRRTVHSYWDGEAERSDTLPRGIWLEDQLPLTLRSLDWAQQGELKVRLLPTTLSNRAPAGKPAEATIKRTGEETLAAAGTQYACDRIQVQVGKRTLEYWIARDGERPLVKFKDGTGQGTLKSLTRTAYWVSPKK